MALLGPMVVVAENPAAELIDVLGQAGAFPIVETNWARAPSAVGEILPAALVLAEATPPPEPRLGEALIKSSNLGAAHSCRCWRESARMARSPSHPRCRSRPTSRRAGWLRGSPRRCACARCM